jgi:hypothetical protein
MKQARTSAIALDKESARLRKELTLAQARLLAATSRIAHLEAELAAAREETAPRKRIAAAEAEKD